jgi:hypothetical protein
LYKKLRDAGSKCPELPTQHVNRVSALNNKRKRVKKRALLDLDIGSTSLEQVMLLSTQLLNEEIIGSYFLINCEAAVSVPEQTITLRVDEEAFNFEFTGTKETIANRFGDLRLISLIPRFNNRQQLLRRVKATQRILPQVVEKSYFRTGRGILVHV